MKRSQWFTFAIILIIGGLYLLNYGAISLLAQNDVGFIRAGIYGAFGQTLIILGFAFGICSILEGKK